MFHPRSSLRCTRFTQSTPRVVLVGHRLQHRHVQPDPTFEVEEYCGLLARTPRKGPPQSQATRILAVRCLDGWRDHSPRTAIQDDESHLGHPVNRIATLQ